MYVCIQVYFNLKFNQKPTERMLAPFSKQEAHKKRVSFYMLFSKIICNQILFLLTCLHKYTSILNYQMHLNILPILICYIILLLYFPNQQRRMKVVGKKHYKQYTLNTKDILGAGSFGKVYYSPPYAVKEMNFQGMSPFVINSLKNQITILNTINHPNVVKLVDFFYEGTCVYLVMEYCEQDLSAYLKKNKCNEKMALHIFKQLVLGFRQLVNLGIIHRDLKPANILVNSKGQFKLADFGFAKFVDHYDSKLLYSIVGTPLYMSPQILSKSQYTTKSDIWSLGFIFYEMLTGTFPWMGMSEADLYKNITTRPLNIPNSISAYSRQLITKMLKINEKQRIGWQDLFTMVLAPNYNVSPQKARPQSREGRMEKQVKQVKQETKQNKENGKATSRRKLFPQTPDKKNEKNDRAKSNKKVDGQERQNIVDMEKKNKENPGIVVISEEVIRQIFLAQVERIFGDESYQKISSKGYNSMSSKQKQQFQKTLQNFNEEFQKVVRTIFKGGFK